MNILVVTQMYSQPDDVGDNKPTKTVNYFVKEWVKLGHNVVVMHCPSKFPLIAYLLPDFIKSSFAGRISTMVPPIESRKNLQREENGAKVYRIPMFKCIPGQGYSVGAMKKQVRKIKQILHKIDMKPDVVVGHFANPSCELVAKLAAEYGAKSSIVFHHDCDQKNAEKYRLKESIAGIGAIGARSIIEAHQVKEILQLNKLPFVCCSGVPDQAVLSATKKCDKQDYSAGVKHVYVGSLIKRKNLDAVIDAFAQTSSEKDVLNIVGGGPELENLVKHAGSTTSKGKINFVGRVSREEVFDYMCGAQVFTLISHGETYGMVYIEAMLQGCLVIASAGGGFDGIIQDGVNGFICEPGNPDMLAKIYRRISNMTVEERNRIGQNAIDTAIHYSESEVAERYLKDILNNQ